MLSDMDSDTLSVPKHTQLFEGFDALKGAGCEAWKATKEASSVAIKPDMPKRVWFDKMPGGRSDRVGIAPARDGRARKIQSTLFGIAHDFDHIRVVPLLRRINGVSNGAHDTLRSRLKQGSAVVDEGRFDQRLISLQVDNPLLFAKPKEMACFSQSITAR
jgi:hypothetical protein